MADSDRPARGGRRANPSVVLDRVRNLKAQAQQGKYDASTWESVVEDLPQLPAGDEAKAVFEEILDTMPSAVAVWLKYIRMELEQGGLDAVKVLFGRCLLTCPSVDLHMLYLRFIKQVNEGRGAQGAVELRAAYEFSLDTVGQDMGAGPLWRDYLDFLQAARPGGDAFAALFPGGLEGQEEAARTPLVRRAFQRAVVVPSEQLETLWRSYEGWELKLDKQLGRKMLDEWRPRYQAARNTLRDRRRVVGDLDMDALPLPPGMGGSGQARQAKLWRQYLDYESSNPQRLEPGSPMLTSRIALAHGQCLVVLWNFPEMWFQYAHIQLLSSGPDAALGVLQRGQAALPGCSLLRLAQAELLETTGNLEGAQQVYDSMVELLEKEMPQASEPQQGPDAPKQEPSHGSAQLSPFGADQGVLIWLQYIRFQRRTASAGISRQTFLRARKWQQSSIALAPLIPPKNGEGVAPTVPNGGQLYAGMSRLEWSLDRTTPAVACRLFELGLEDPRLARDAAFINAYGNFLCEVGDVDNARALYERVLNEREVSVAVPVWRNYAVMEANQGNPAAALQIEERMRGALAAAAEPGGLPPGAEPPMHPAIASLQVALVKYGPEGLMPCEAPLVMHLKQAAFLLPPPTVDDQGVKDPGRPDRRRRDWGDRDRDYDRYDRDRDAREGSLEEGGRAGAGPGPMKRERDRERDREPREVTEIMGDELLELLISQLPPPMAVEGPLVPVEAVMDVCVFADMSPAVVNAVCADLDVGVMPNGISTGVAVPQIVGMAGPPPPREGFFFPPEEGGPPDGRPFHDDRGGPLQHDGPYQHDPYGPSHDHPYQHPSEPWMQQQQQQQQDFPPYGPPHGPMSGPGPRKRRWEGPPEGRGPPPFEYDGPPPYDEHYGPLGGERGPMSGQPPHWERDRDRDRGDRDRERRPPMRMRRENPRGGRENE